MSYDRRKFIKMIEANGFYFNRQTGDHLIHINERGRHISIPLKLNRMIAKRLIKENNLELDVKQLKKKQRMNAPIGSDFDIDAPWNEEVEKPLELYTSITVSKAVTVDVIDESNEKEWREKVKCALKKDIDYLKKEGYCIDDLAIIC